MFITFMFIMLFYCAHHLDVHRLNVHHGPIGVNCPNFHCGILLVFIALMLVMFLFFISVHQHHVCHFFFYYRLNSSFHPSTLPNISN
jgi:hypothetical protein